MKKNRLQFALLIFCFSFFNSTSYAKRVSAKEIVGIETTLDSNNKMLQQLKGDLHTAEKELKTKQKKFQKTKNFKEKLHDEIKQLEESISKNSQYITKVDEIYKEELNNVLLRRLNKEKNSSHLLADKVFEKSLAKKIMILTNLKQVNKTLNEEYVEFRTRYDEYSNIQGHLHQLLIDLESRKSAIKEKVYQYKSKKGRLNKKLSALKKTISAHKSAELGEFISPLSEYKKFTYAKKGITYYLKGQTSLKAPRAGKIVHVGRLANYGNVIMIDHGDDIRSVLLGRFKSKTKKGDSVSVGDIIGYTLNSKTNLKKNASKVYFEVRKKNKVYTTINLVKNLKA